jgi:predicted MFS family arabinose efflux permease
VVSPRDRGRASLTPDVRRIFVAQAARGAVYGLGSIVIGVSLEQSGLSTTRVGVVFTAMLAGIALVSIVLARYGDRFGRRQAYRALLVAMAGAGLVFAFTDSLPALILAALTGTISVDIVESGPFTSLEQAMLPHAAGDANVASVFGTYNTVATLAGSLGALTAFFAASRHWLLVYPFAALVALLAVARLSTAVEGGRELTLEQQPSLHRSKGIVARLSTLFALDSFGGGFVVQSFIAYWFALKFGTSHQTLALVFLAIGFIQAASFQIAVRLSHRIGLLRTMVFTHLPSNVLLAAIAFAPTFAVALALLLARYVLSQMDVPARQAYVAVVVDPSERTAAAAYTNTARYVTRPVGPLVGGVSMTLWLGAPFLIAGALKSVYDLGLYAIFRRVKVTDGQS